MVRYLLRRLVLGIITLWLLATIVFAITNILPTDVGRTILGPFAPPETVAALRRAYPRHWAARIVADGIARGSRRVAHRLLAGLALS